MWVSLVLDEAKTLAPLHPVHLTTCENMWEPKQWRAEVPNVSATTKELCFKVNILYKSQTYNISFVMRLQRSVLQGTKPLLFTTNSQLSGFKWTCCEPTQRNKHKNKHPLRNCVLTFLYVCAKSNVICKCVSVLTEALSKTQMICVNIHSVNILLKQHGGSVCSASGSSTWDHNYCWMTITAKGTDTHL